MADFGDILLRESNNLPIGYITAWALAETGQKEQALKILDVLLEKRNGSDPGYELLTKLLGSDAIPLDALTSHDRFETRPLIWKAQVLLDSGKLDDAERTVQAAVAIDPTDGKSAPGRRLREYAVLADVLGRKGDEAHAENLSRGGHGRANVEKADASPMRSC